MLPFTAQIRGRDGKHSISGNAESLMDACRQMIEYGAKQYWWDPDANIVVRAGGQTWRVKHQAALDWYLRKIDAEKRGGNSAYFARQVREFVVSISSSSRLLMRLKSSAESTTGFFHWHRNYQFRERISTDFPLTTLTDCP